mgnify:CR=1 FL=1
MPSFPRISRPGGLFELAQLAGLEALRRYFRLDTIGGERLPRTGPALVVANHSGVSGLDALLLRHEIGRITGRDARILANRAWFSAPAVQSELPEGLGLVAARLPRAVSVLREGRVLIVFPEAERGNFKPSDEAYHLRSFRPAFVRMAAEAGAPIIPVAVRGAEETHINLASLDLPRGLSLRMLPLPLNLLPLPSKWRIDILEPTPAPALDQVRDRGAAEAEAERMRAVVQEALDADR